MSKVGQRWTLKYQRILMYSEKGMSNNEIASKLSLNPHTVSHIKGSDEFLIRQTNFRRSVIEQVQGVFEKKAKKAAQQVCNIMKAGTAQDKVKLDAARDILDRIGSLAGTTEDQEIEQMARQANSIRTFFFDKRKKMEDIIPQVLLVKSDYIAKEISPNELFN